MVNFLKRDYTREVSRVNDKVYNEYRRLSYSLGTSIHHIVSRKNGGGNDMNNLVEMHHFAHQKVHDLLDVGRKYQAQKIIDEYVQMKNNGERLDDDYTAIVGCTVDAEYVRAHVEKVKAEFNGMSNEEIKAIFKIRGASSDENYKYDSDYDSFRCFNYFKSVGDKTLVYDTD